MARKPSYDFERRERDKAKAAKKEERAKTKSDRKTGSAVQEQTEPPPDREPQ